MVVLRNSGLLSAQDASLVEKDSLESLSTNDNMNVPETYHEAVEQSLDNFVKSSPSLNENKDRKAVFAVGAMVGALSKYQRRQRGLSQRLVDKHPISRMGPQRLQQAFTDGVDIATTYGGAEDRDIDMVQDTYVEFAQDALQDVSIDSLSLSNADIKYHYSLGVSYALNVYVEYDDSNDDNS